MTLDGALDEIYRSYLRARPLVAGRFDRDVRHPEIVHRIASRLGLLPPRERVIKITGSKGKGTTARFAADLVAQARPNARVALFVSPHEIEQTDRIRLDGKPIPADEFCRIVERISAAVCEEEKQLPPDQYISPVGYFLLVALDWYWRHGADYFILECGRGARWDDIGQIPSCVSVVTSVLLEHADTLGPALDDIAHDKFSVTENSNFVVTSAGAQKYAPRGFDQRMEAVGGAPPAVGPRWIGECRTLAQRAAERLLALAPGTLDRTDPRIASASFGQERTGETLYAFEAAINADSLDPAFIAALPRDTTVLACLPDNKDRARMLAALSRIGRVREIALTGAEDYLHFIEANAASAIALDKDDAPGLRDLIHEHGSVYLVGTQSFIRLVHLALLQEAACSV
ncbi:MAG: hypothetical protein Q8R02_09205 [Hyphomonadaceae bacterium]|nr:hypothetical protein [Hyphomonadaceae bacterium]